MNLEINVYEYGREGKCVYMFRHTYAGIREMKIHFKNEIRHMSRVMLVSIGTVTEVFIKFVEKEKRKQEGS